MDALPNIAKQKYNYYMNLLLRHLVRWQVLLRQVFKKFGCCLNGPFE